jgi:hypothetical protein
VKFLSTAEMFAPSQRQLAAVFAKRAIECLLFHEIRLPIRWLRASLAWRWRSRGVIVEKQEAFGKFQWPE